jgi:general secretion pathway protein I
MKAVTVQAKTPMTRNARQKGFTLIEAIVALVLLATTGMALFSWINTNMITLFRIQEINAENEATVNAVEFMNSINPMTTPEGAAPLGAYQLHWKATETTPPRDGAGYPYGTSLYQLAMYDTQVTLEKPDGQTWLNFTLAQVGYKKVREFIIPG